MRSYPDLGEEDLPAALRTLAGEHQPDRILMLVRLLAERARPLGAEQGAELEVSGD